MRPFHPARLFLGFALLAFAAISARATSVLPLYLDEIADTAAVAFEGTVTENRTQLDPATHLVVTYTTFAVHDVLKGAAGTKYTIKQVGGKLAGTPEAGAFTIRGVPTFELGRTYVVFLAGVSAAGFSSPIGLSQGRFGVSGSGTARTVTSGRDFKELTARMTEHLPARALAALSRSGPAREMDLGDFKQLLRGHYGGRP